MLMQKRPLFKQLKKNLNKTDLLRLHWVRCSLLKKYSVIEDTIEQYTVNEVSSSSKFIKSPASGSSDLIYNNWKSNKNDL